MVWVGVGNHEEKCRAPELATTGGPAWDDLPRLREGGSQPRQLSVSSSPARAPHWPNSMETGGPRSLVGGGYTGQPPGAEGRVEKSGDGTGASGIYLERYKGSPSVSYGGQGPALGRLKKSRRRIGCSWAEGEQTTVMSCAAAPLLHFNFLMWMGHGQGF